MRLASLLVLSCFSFEYLSKKKCCDKLSFSRACILDNETLEQKLNEVFEQRQMNYG